MRRGTIARIVQETSRLTSVTTSTGVDRGPMNQESASTGQMNGDTFEAYGRFNVTPFSDFRFAGKTAE